jgi:hypothetical protein
MFPEEVLAIEQRVLADLAEEGLDVQVGCVSCMTDSKRRDLDFKTANPSSWLTTAWDSNFALTWPKGIGTGEQSPDDQGKVETVFARTAMGRVDIC